MVTPPPAVVPLREGGDGRPDVLAELMRVAPRETQKYLRERRAANPPRVVDEEAALERRKAELTKGYPRMQTLTKDDNVIVVEDTDSNKYLALMVGEGDKRARVVLEPGRTNRKQIVAAASQMMEKGQSLRVHIKWSFEFNDDVSAVTAAHVDKVWVGVPEYADLPRGVNHRLGQQDPKVEPLMYDDMGARQRLWWDYTGPSYPVMLEPRGLLAGSKKPEPAKKTQSLEVKEIQFDPDYYHSRELALATVPKQLVQKFQVLYSYDEKMAGVRAEIVDNPELPKKAKK